MSKHEYKNISDQDLSVVGVGLVPAGETVKTDVLIENANFELVDKSKKSKEKSQ